VPLRRTGLDPVPALARMRAIHPVHRMGRALGMGVWVVTGYDETRAVLRDTDAFSTDIRPLVGAGDGPSIGGLGFTDPPDHTRLRRMLAPHFTGRRLAVLTPAIQRIVDRQLDLLDDGREVVDLATEFAFPVPFSVIGELLGLTVEQSERFHQLGRNRFDARSGFVSPFGAMSESHSFLLETVRTQRLDPGPGLIGDLIRQHGSDIDDEQLARLVDGVFTGGYETSASMLTLGTVTLLAHPEVGAALAVPGADATPVIDELLRYLSVVQIGFPRFAKRDLDLFGQRVRAGDVVIPSLSAANRDPSLGADAESFAPGRTAPSHLAFGYGMHRCVGSELARTELAIALTSLLRRFPDLALDVPAESLQYRELSVVYGLDHLPVRLRSRTDRTAP
jgi:cytochrome P450